MRLIVDLLGNRHKDLFIKIDLFPVNDLIISDSYYWVDFLKIDDKLFENISDEESTKIISTEILKFWEKTFKSIEKNQTKYLPIDLSDEYVLLFKVTKSKLGFKMQKIISSDFTGWSFNKESIETNLKINFELDNEEFLISEKIIFDGLEWSFKQLKNVV